MAFLREKYRLTIGVFRLPEIYADLPFPGRTLQLFVTNLRNRSLSSASVESMRDLVLSLYHHLVTGSRDFPVIPFGGFFRTLQTLTPFLYEEHRENINHPSMTVRPGMMMPPAGSAPRTIWTPVLPERVEPGTLRRDPRNSIQRLEVRGQRVSRVISPVFDSNHSEMTNRWRVSDYAEDGSCLMSVLCRFTEWSTQCMQRPRNRERDSEEEESSSQCQPKKRLRL